MLVLLPQQFHHNRFPGRGNCDLGRITQWRETNASTVCFNLNAVWELPADAGYNWEIRETEKSPGARPGDTQWLKPISEMNGSWLRSKISNLLDPWVAYVSSYTSWCVKYCNETSEEPCNIKKLHHQNWENCYHRLGKLLAPWLPTNITNYGYPFQHPRVLLSGSGKLWIGLVFEQHVFARHLLVRSSSQDSASWPMVPWDVHARLTWLCLKMGCNPFRHVRLRNWSSTMIMGF
jgi:hypothetical protein